MFVESNWLFAYAAPPHHQVPTAAALLDRARNGEFALHMPNICIGEARLAILTKPIPDVGRTRGTRNERDAAITRTVLDKYESSIRRHLENLDNVFRGLAGLPCREIFGLDDAMLARATELALSGIALKPFDHAMLAGILVRAPRLQTS